MTLGHSPNRTNTDAERLAELMEQARQARADYEYAVLRLRLFTKQRPLKLEENRAKV